MSLVNRDPSAPVEVTIDIADAPFDVTGAHVISGDPKAANGWDAPDAVKPIRTEVRVAEQGALHLTLQAPSHTVISIRRRDVV